MKKILLITVLAIFWRPVFADTEIDRWNEVALKAISWGRLNPLTGSRVLAMVHIAAFEAINAVEKKYEPFSREFKAGPDILLDVAVAAAAKRVLWWTIPNQKYSYERAYEEIAKKYKSHPKYSISMTLGETTAEEIIRDRTDDVQYMKMSVDFIADPVPGKWLPTMPYYENPTLPRWGKIRTFALVKGSQFRSPSPPSLDSAEYKKDLAEVQIIGGLKSKSRTVDQTQIAHFWADGPGTMTPPGHYNVMARVIASSKKFTLQETAHMLAVLNIALADAAIGCWDTKYAYWFWRPATIFRDNRLEPDWEPLLYTPPFPEYVSGHSTFSGTANKVLIALFKGDNVSFNLRGDEAPGVTRNFKSISQATWESGKSRIYGGIHFEFSNRLGQELGNKIGDYILKKVYRPKKEVAAK